MVRCAVPARATPDGRAWAEVGRDVARLRAARTLGEGVAGRTCVVHANVVLDPSAAAEVVLGRAAAFSLSRLLATMDRKLAVLAVVHNSHIRRPDGLRADPDVAGRGVGRTLRTAGV